MVDSLEISVFGNLNRESGTLMDWWKVSLPYSHLASSTVMPQRRVFLNLLGPEHENKFKLTVCPSQACRNTGAYFMVGRASHSDISKHPQLIA